MSVRSVIHCIANCTVCGAVFDDYLTAQSKAREHAKDTGHYVTGEVASRFSYGKSTFDGSKFMNTKNR